jgi:hypothetical protein
MRQQIIDRRSNRRSILVLPETTMLLFDMAISVSVTPNASVQPQIRAQREFVGWNTLLGLTPSIGCIEFAPDLTEPVQADCEHNAARCYQQPGQRDKRGVGREEL